MSKKWSVVIRKTGKIVCGNFDTEREAISHLIELTIRDKIYGIFKEDRYDIKPITHEYRVYRMIQDLEKQYPEEKVAFIFILAMYAVKDLEEKGIYKFISYLPSVADEAKQYKWHGGVADALRIFCDLCLVDYKFVEYALGFKLEKFENVKNTWSLI